MGCLVPSTCTYLNHSTNLAEEEEEETAEGGREGMGVGNICIKSRLKGKGKIKGAELVIDR